MIIDQIIHSLERLIQVQKVIDLTSADSTNESELALVKIITKKGKINFTLEPKDGLLLLNGIDISNKKAIILAKSVKAQSSKYRRQLKSCKKNLDRKKYFSNENSIKKTGFINRLG